MPHAPWGIPEGFATPVTGVLAFALTKLNAKLDSYLNFYTIGGE
jgi:hypothetical protein